jgi:hypothetical protein
VPRQIAGWGPVEVLAFDLLLSANSADNDKLTERPTRRSAKLNVTLPTYMGGNVTSNSRSRLTLSLDDSNPRRRHRGRTALRATPPPPPYTSSIVTAVSPTSRNVV